MVGCHIMVSNNTSFGQYLCYQLEFLLAFLIQITCNYGLLIGISFGLLSAEKLELENSNFCHFSILALGTILWYYGEGFHPDFSLIS